jgi:hypothetical protein
MIELNDNRLVFRFPEIEHTLRAMLDAWLDAHLAAATAAEKARLPSSRRELRELFVDHLPAARAAVEFQRTLRIPDDGHDHPLPPGLGQFPVRHVDDFAGTPAAWKKHGGVMLPMHRTEAMWLQFSAECPVALKIAAGGICAVSGERWAPGLRSERQNYVVLPGQPWLDGFRVAEGVIRQFVAVPLGKGLTVEKQLTNEESWGGLQLQAHPLSSNLLWESLLPDLELDWRERVAPPPSNQVRFARRGYVAGIQDRCCCASVAEAGLGAGGRMRQSIEADPYGANCWETSITSRCYVHLCLAEDWQRLTGAPPPHRPPTAKDYTNAGLPWFDYSASAPVITGKTVLSEVKSVNTLLLEKCGVELGDNHSVEIDHLVTLKPALPGTVREF